MTIDEANGTSKILNRLDSIAANDSSISCKEFEVFLREEAEENINPSTFHELLKFISAQCGFWSANWYFSEEASPDLNAKAESEQWEELWQASASALTEDIPIPTSQMQKEHNLIVLQESLQRRVEFNESNMLEKYSTSVYSYLAIQLNKIGLKTIANNIYTKSLFPKGAVGRIA